MTVWAAWRRIAHRAAVVQSNVLLFILYFVFVLPVSLVIRLMTTRRRTACGWQALPTAADELQAARQQFS
jgi:hypothetical protein